MKIRSPIKIAKSEWDTKNMFHYTKGIRRLQRELKTSVSEFPQFGLINRITVAEDPDRKILSMLWNDTKNFTN